MFNRSTPTIVSLSRAHDCSKITSRATTLSRLARAIIAEGRVALIELLLDTGAVTPERRHVGAAGFGRERQRLEFSAGPHRRACAHDLHRAVYRTLVELLQFDRNLCGSLGE